MKSNSTGNAMNRQNIQPTLRERLAPAVQRVRAKRIFLTIAIVLLLFTSVGAVLFWLIKAGQIPSQYVWIALLAGGTVTALLACIPVARSVSLEATAKRLESRFPDLNASLLTALEQDAGKPLSFLQQDVIRAAVYHSYQQPWTRLVPNWQLLGSPALAMLSLVSLAITAIAIALYAIPPATGDRVQFESTVIQQPLDFKVQVEPGDIEVEKGANLLVLARFGEALPSRAELVAQSQSGEEYRYSMNKSLDDPLFGARIPAVTEDLQYHVEFDQRRSQSFDITVFEYPALVRNQVQIHYPDYTKQTPKQLENVRRVSAVEGSTAALVLSLNKPVASAVLRSKSGETIDLVLDAEEPTRYRANVALTEPGSKRFRLLLVDEQKRENKDAVSLVFNVLKNGTPELKLTRPARDLQISALEELDLQADVWDDFGLQAVGVSYMLGNEIKELQLSGEIGAKQKETLETTLAMEELGAKVDQLVSYYFWAEDFGPEGNLRRISSDMYFAEIRPFDEIYRRGQAPPNGQSPQSSNGNTQLGQTAQQLAELQKEIINATWKVIRRETAAQPTNEFTSDVDLLAESQQAAIGLLDQAREQQESARASQDLADAKHFMTEAHQAFESAANAKSPKRLKPALKNTQLAYQALLKLKSKEHQVARTQQQQQSGQQNANSRQQQQLEQMELTEEENRYEQERKAAPEDESLAQRENRQILSRLKELARRQTDLNERIKELQSSLDEATTEEEKKELERELKRLRDEQRKIADDLEDLQERMQQSEDQQAMSQPADQTEQARQNAQRAAESLSQNQLSRAAAEGQRAENQLNELKEEFQNRTSGQFVQQMREMRNEAQQLELDEQQLSQALQELDQQNNDRTQLRGQDNREQIEQELQEQAARVNQLREEMKTVIEEAEQFEPLLAEELYDTYRQAERQRADDALNSASRSLSRGFTNDAIAEEIRGREGIEELRQGIEDAAENILGDETKALEAARDRIDQLKRELEEEIAQNSGRPIPPPGGDPQPDSDLQFDPFSFDQPTPNPENSNDSERTGNPGPRRWRTTTTTTTQQSGATNSARQSEQPTDQPGEQRPRDQAANRQGGSRNSPDDLRPGLRDAGNPLVNRAQREGDPNLNDRNAAPLTGDDFLDWMDRLRDVESLVPLPELRAEAARLRERAKEFRRDYKRHSKDPAWPLVRMQLAVPLAELQQKVTEELIRRSSKNARVPLEREVVPSQYRSTVERYFEQLGSGEPRN